MSEKLVRIAQRRSALQKIHEFTNIGRRFSESRHDFYRQQMKNLREVDDRIRQYAIGEAGQPGLKQNLKLVKDYVKQGRSVRAMYHLVEIGNIVDKIVQEVIPLKKERDQFIREFYSETGEEPMGEPTKEWEALQKHFKKAAFLNDTSGRLGSMFEGISRGRVSRLLEKVYHNEVNERRKAMISIQESARFLVEFVIRTMKVLGDLRARGDVSDYIKTLDSIKKEYDSYITKYSEFYHKHVEGLKKDEAAGVAAPGTPIPAPAEVTQAPAAVPATEAPSAVAPEPAAAPQSLPVEPASEPVAPSTDADISVESPASEGAAPVSAVAPEPPAPTVTEPEPVSPDISVPSPIQTAPSVSVAPIRRRVVQNVPAVAPAVTPEEVPVTSETKPEEPIIEASIGEAAQKVAEMWNEVISGTADAPARFVNLLHTGMMKGIEAGEGQENIPYEISETGQLPAPMNRVLLGVKAVTSWPDNWVVYIPIVLEYKKGIEDYYEITGNGKYIAEIITPTFSDGKDVTKGKLRMVADRAQIAKKPEEAAGGSEEEELSEISEAAKPSPKRKPVMPGRIPAAKPAKAAPSAAVPAAVVRRRGRPAKVPATAEATLGLVKEALLNGERKKAGRLLVSYAEQLSDDAMRQEALNKAEDLLNGR